MTDDDLEKFVGIIKGGGQIICAPDVFAAIEAASPMVTSVGGVKIRVSRFAKPGMIYAVSKDAALRPGDWKYAELSSVGRALLPPAP